MMLGNAAPTFGARTERTRLAAHFSMQLSFIFLCARVNAADITGSAASGGADALRLRRRRPAATPPSGGGRPDPAQFNSCSIYTECS